MKESPILFTTDMVQAILEGRKTQTRRIFKDHPRLASDLKNIDLKKWFQDYPDYMLSFSPFGECGDLLWVRETWAKSSIDPLKYFFRASVCSPKFDMPAKGWKSPLHMTKIIARIWLQIESVKIERIQEITHEDAKSEGIKYSISPVGFCGYDYRYNSYNLMTTPKSSFFSLWCSIYGIDSWVENPWVWAITFKVVSTTGKPMNLQPLVQ